MSALSPARALDSYVMSSSVSSPPSSPPQRSPSMSPRHSDTSLNSVPAPFASADAAAAAAHRACDPLVLPLPAHASTSTISRSSHASNDDHFLHPPSFTRLPKAKVFVRREPSRLANNNNNNNKSLRSLHERTLRPPAKPADKRCVSDIHDVYHVMHNNRPLAKPCANGNDRVRTDLHSMVDQLPDVNQVPAWVPPRERRDWTAQYAFDPCEVEEDDHPSSRWATSLRNLANMYKPKPVKSGAVRGSVLRVQPPTLGERLGFSSKGDKRRHPSKPPAAPTNQSCPRQPKRSKRRPHDPQLPRSKGCTVNDRQSEQMSCYADDYVGFLEKPSAHLLYRRHRSSWFARFLRRGRAAARS